MENQDKDFEAFLGQFRLRQASPLLQDEPVAAPVRTARWWFLGSAAAAVVLLSLFVLMRDGAQQESPITAGPVFNEPSEARDQSASRKSIRADSDGTSFSLPDGTDIEMKAGSELSFESVADGIRVSLDTGSILVTAAAQPSGHLYVRTTDTLVSVTGTVFLVETRPTGTRVGVIEGKVEVRQGTMVRTVTQGEQTSTDPKMQAQRLSEAMAWSRRARSILLAQDAVPPVDAESRRREVSSERQRTVVLPEGAVGGPAPGAPSLPYPPSPPPAPAPPAPAEAIPQEAIPQEHQGDSGTEDPGKQIFVRSCGACHSLEVAGTSKYENREALEELVKRQVAYGASVSATEMPVLLDYLWKTYGIKKVR